MDIPYVVDYTLLVSGQAVFANTAARHDLVRYIRAKPGSDDGRFPVGTFCDI